MVYTLNVILIEENNTNLSIICIIPLLVDISFFLYLVRFADSFKQLFSYLHIYFVQILRTVKKSEGDIPVPPLVESAVLWGMPKPIDNVLTF